MQRFSFNFLIRGSIFVVSGLILAPNLVLSSKIFCRTTAFVAKTGNFDKNLCHDSNRSHLFPFININGYKLSECRLTFGGHRLIGEGLLSYRISALFKISMILVDFCSSSCSCSSILRYSFCRVILYIFSRAFRRKRIR